MLERTCILVIYIYIKKLHVCIYVQELFVNVCTCIYETYEPLRAYASMYAYINFLLFIIVIVNDSTYVHMYKLYVQHLAS